jgi:hypothetical protein
MIFNMIFAINPLIALGVVASTAATDAAYVFFTAAVTSRRRVWAANWSAVWYMLSAFAVISYTENALRGVCGARFLARGLRLDDLAAPRTKSAAAAPRSAAP